MAPYEQTWPEPYVDNLQSDDIVYNRLVLVTGRAGPSDISFDGEMSITSYNEGSMEPPISAQSWPVTDTYFKALVPVSPGSNNLRFRFIAPKAWRIPDSSACMSELTITYVPLIENQPLHLVILAAKDSPLTVDCTPDRRGMHDHIEATTAKMQLWAYMCQAFTAEQCRRNSLGRRPFALQEEVGPDTLDAIPPQFQRRRPVVHLVRSRHTLAEFRDPDVAQQNPNARRSGDLHGWATEALLAEDAPPFCKSPQGAYVAVLLLDSHWDSQNRLLLGHAALGAGGPVSPHPKIGVFGSHSCWSWPRTLQEVVPSFLDTSDVDERYVVNDLGNIGTAWETLNVGHGAFLHECGHALNNPHHESGIMARGYHEYNRSFMTTERQSKRTNTSSCRLITPETDCKENHWNRMSLLRLRYHPTMRLPSDPAIPYRYTGIAPTFTVVGDGLAVHAQNGLGSIEIQVNNRYRTHIEYPFCGTSCGQPPPQRVRLTHEHIAQLCGTDPSSCKVTIEAIGTDQRQAEIADYGELCRSSRLIVNVTSQDPAAPIPTSMSSSNKLMRALHKLSNNERPTSSLIVPGAATAGPRQMVVIKGIQVGQSNPHNPAFLHIFKFYIDAKPKLAKVTIHAGGALDGFKLHWTDNSVQTIGPCSGGEARTFNVSPPSKVVRIITRSGAWMDAVSVVWEHGETGLVGSGGGELRVLDAPAGSEICGLHGTAGAWMNSLGLLYTA